MATWFSSVYRLFNGLTSVDTANNNHLGAPTMRIFTRDEHNISRKNISKNALKVLYRLDEAGFESYLVGGGVRDLLLNKAPKDFDISTNASPDEVKALFKNCRLIGRRFRLAHVVFGRDIIEVATFRASHSEGAGGAIGDGGRIVRDNVYGGTLADDAERRDFTVNALFYNIADFTVIDFFGGMDDLESGELKFIGNAAERVIEDPVRALRAARFAAKLDFKLHSDVRAAIELHRHKLSDIPAARLFDEVLKLLQSGHGVQSFMKLRELGLFEFLFPRTDKKLQTGDQYTQLLIKLALENTDRRIQAGQPVTPAYIYAVMLWPDVADLAAEYQESGLPPVLAINSAADDIVPSQLDATSLPRRFSVPMREIWSLQPRLFKTSGKKASLMLSNPRFRAAYDFLCLRAQAGEGLQSLCDIWEKLQDTPEAQAAIDAARQRARAARSKKRPQRRRNRGPASDPANG